MGFIMKWDHMKNWFKKNYAQWVIKNSILLATLGLPRGKGVYLEPFYGSEGHNFQPKGREKILTEKGSV